MSSVAYRRLVESVELDELALLVFEHHREAEAHPPFKVSSEFTTSLEDCPDGKITALANFHLKAVSDATNSEEMLMKMVWQLIYSFSCGEDLEVDIELKQKFVERNVPVNVWPYIREIVATMTAKMGFPPLVLPTLKIVR